MGRGKYRQDIGASSPSELELTELQGVWSRREQCEQSSLGAVGTVFEGYFMGKFQKLEIYSELDGFIAT